MERIPTRWRSSSGRSCTTRSSVRWTSVRTWRTSSRASRSRTRRAVVTYVVAIVAVAFVFDFINGFHDSANSIATVVGTRVLSPIAAVVWAAVFNFAAVLGGTAVAKAVATGFVDPALVDPNLMFAALLGAIIWNLITW